MRESIDALNIKHLVTDSRKIGHGDTFVAYVGENMDGRNFISDAVRRGAASVIWEEEGFSWDASLAVPNLAIRNLREKSGEIASHVYGEPSKKLWIVGVTGTNGKTSSTHWIAQALSELGKKTAVIGTLGNGFPGALSPTINTTPDAVALHELLAEYLEAGAQCVAMEVSSHALSQGRVNGIRFDVALFTNLTRDHLDYHGDMASYGEAKARLFDFPELEYAVLNLDDAFGSDLMKRPTGAKKIAYGFSEMSEVPQVRGKNLKMEGGMLSMDIESSWGSGTVNTRAIGRFNASNLLGVLSVLLAGGFELQATIRALSAIEAVPGRMQQIGGDGAPLVVVDYAHTPDALESVLDALREISVGKLVCVFGCGGNRDPGKRPMMGEIASRLSDRVYVTSDNPRDEDVDAIISQIVGGTEGDCCVIRDRAEAIRQAILGANREDLVLLAGKGHEDYQEIGGERLPFSDIEVARDALQSWGAAC
ncbi:MAG: UDP-N-acetylmuramoyl-L-alanyl-D-glutamate--2,6-diaminopimelate ligase [Burkholderiales bacterium]